jgi:hypothetical protein
MSENIESLILEHLKRFQAGQDRIETKLDEFIMRLGEVEVGIAKVKGEVAHLEGVDAGLSVRMDRSDRKAVGAFVTRIA